MIKVNKYTEINIGSKEANFHTFKMRKKYLNLGQ